MLYKQYFK
uniref:Uncharacterized protein n=1 Tax=Arundo donax TaxID=35708 RepID=A0A0A8ZEU0_ARUDO